MYDDDDLTAIVHPAVRRPGRALEQGNRGLTVRRATAACAALLLVAAPGWRAAGSDDETTVASEQAFVAGDGSIVEIAPEDRRPAPDIRGTT